MNFYFKGYKNFKGENYIGFDEIKPINILIGKNNIGKSSFLEIIENLKKSGKTFKGLSYESIILETDNFEDEEIEKYFAKYTSGGGIRGNHYEFASRYKNNKFRLEYDPRRGAIISLKMNGKELEEGKTEFSEMILKQFSTYFVDREIIRMNADRNLIPESSSNSMAVSPSGEGATNLVRLFLNRSTLDEKLVKVTLLQHLNEIVTPDFEFVDILCQEIDESESSDWEIYLEEINKGRVALSDSGSGLRTILLVLINLILVPNIERYSQNKIIYIFEELENNLHPAVQRNLFSFLKDWIINNSCQLFITTHSNVSIDLFAKDKDAQIIHILKNEHDEIESRTAFNSLSNNEILDDIGVRASDIMQSNGIIWVEGPSDRIYINKWLELVCGNKFKEGQDYQILFYGGRLLSHLSAEENEDNEFINLLRANRHSIIIMDSDKKYKAAQINKTKKRIKEEFDSYEALVWITKGREIENYILPEIISEYFKLKKLSMGQYSKIEEDLNKANQLKKSGIKYSSNKVKYAKELVKLMDEKSLEVLDLKKQLNLVVEKIESWNSN